MIGNSRKKLIFARLQRDDALPGPRAWHATSLRSLKEKY